MRYSTNLILSGAISLAARRYGGTNQQFSTMKRILRLTTPVYQQRCSAVGSCESDRMVAGFQEMAGIMQDRQYQNLELITHMFEDENHVSVTGKRW